MSFKQLFLNGESDNNELRQQIMAAGRPWKEVESVDEVQEWYGTEGHAHVLRVQPGRTTGGMWLPGRFYSDVGPPEVIRQRCPYAQGRPSGLSLWSFYVPRRGFRSFN